MKKINKIIAVIMALTMVAALASPAFAADSKSITFLNDLATSKTVKVGIDNSAFANYPVSVSNVSVAAKFTKNDDKTYKTSIAGSGKAGSLNFKLLGDDDNMYAYLLIFKASVNDITGTKVDISAYTDMFAAVIDDLDAEAIGLLKSSGTSAETNDLYGDVQVETLVPNATAVASAAIATPSKATYYAAFLGTSVSLIYKDGNLVGVRSLTVDKEALTVTSIDTTKNTDFKVTSVTTNVDSDDFSEPFISIDITSLVKTIIGLFK